ncbi:MAG: glycosyltransferase [Candidatus Micrarchaeota archaeon]
MITIILPVYNQCRMLRNVERVAAAAEKLGMPYEIIIAEDGSTDGSAEEAMKLAESNPKVVHLHSDERLGRGEALKRAFKAGKGDYLIYMDIDLATDLSALQPLVNALAKSDVAIGSRYHSLSKTKRTPKRLFLSKVYNNMIRLFTGAHVSDFQCGFKGFRREFVEGIMDDVRDNGWFWDTEIVVLAQRGGFSVEEVPVEWEEKRGSTVTILKDSLEMGWKGLMLGWRVRTGG